MKYFSILFVILFVLKAYANDQVTIALNWKAEPQFGGFYQAQLIQNLKKNSFQLNVLEGGSGTPTIQMLANKKVDFAIVSAEEILINNERNSQNQVVALLAVFQTNPQMLMCHAQQAFKNIGEIFSSQSTVAMQSGLTYAQFLRKKYPHHRAKIVPYTGGIGLFLNDEKFCQQGFITSEPLLAAQAGKKATTYLIADEGFNPYTTVVAVHAHTLEKKPEFTRDIVHLFRQGWVAYMANPTQANTLMQSINKAMDAETFRQSAIAQQSLLKPPSTEKLEFGQMSVERWQKLSTQLKDLGIIKKSPPMSTLYKNL